MPKLLALPALLAVVLLIYLSIPHYQPGMFHFFPPGGHGTLPKTREDMKNLLRDVEIPFTEADGKLHVKVSTEQGFFLKYGPDENDTLVISAERRSVFPTLLTGVGAAGASAFVTFWTLVWIARPRW